MLAQCWCARARLGMWTGLDCRVNGLSGAGCNVSWTVLQETRQPLPTNRDTRRTLFKSTSAHSNKTPHIRTLQRLRYRPCTREREGEREGERERNIPAARGQTATITNPSSALSTRYSGTGTRQSRAQWLGERAYIRREPSSA